MLNTLDLLIHQTYQKEMLRRADKERLIRTILSRQGQPTALSSARNRWYGLIGWLRAALIQVQRHLPTLADPDLRHNARRGSQTRATRQWMFRVAERQQKFSCIRRAATQVQRPASYWMRLDKAE